MIKSENGSETSGPVLSRWCVITGAPCSGKTAVINELARRGHGVVHEVARAWVETQLAAGLSLEQIRRDDDTFEHTILNKKAAIERRLDVKKRVFLDRAVPDSIAYFRLAGLDPATPLALSERIRYEKIFLLDRLPVKKDAVRREDEQTVMAIETLLLQCYRSLGYPVIRIPAYSILQRTDNILKHLE